MQSIAQPASLKSIIDKIHPCPGYHYIFFNQDSVLFEEISGLQNIENNIPLDSQTSFNAFSTSKTFTAVAIMQLIEKSKVELEDTVTKYIPEYRFSQPVSIKNLLCHDSGIANPIPLKWTHSKDKHNSFNYKEFCDSVILKHLKLKRSPGLKHAYSNLNYLVLGRIIEVVSGKNYHNYIKDFILNPIANKEFMGFELPESNHATGYHKNSWFQNILLDLLLDREKLMYKVNSSWNGFYPFYVNGSAYGGIFSTPKGMMNFCRALLSNSNPLLSQKSIQLMLTEQKTSKGVATQMCLGWFKGQLNEHYYYCHAGGGGGYYTEIRLYPSLGKGSVIMMNSSAMKDKRILDKLDKEHLKQIK